MKNTPYRKGAKTFYDLMEWIAYALTFRPTPKGVLCEKHVPYGEEKTQYYTLFYRKDLAEKQKPLFIYIHGGGFISGVTDMRNTYVHSFAEAGFLAANVSYTVAPKKVYPAPLQELCSAIDGLVDRAEERRFDPRKVVLCGESAGVYYVFMLAALASDPSLAEKIGVTFRHARDVSIKAVVSHSGCICLPRLLDPAYPQSHYPDIKMMTCSFLGKPYDEAVAFLSTQAGQNAYARPTRAFPPAFFADGVKDKLRFETYDAIKQYKKRNIPYEHFEGTGAYANHAWTIVTAFKQGKACLEKTLAFVKRFV